MFCRKRCLQKFHKFHKKTQAFSCEICKVFKNSYFEKHLRTTASEFIGDTALLHETIFKKHANGKTNFQDGRRVWPEATFWIVNKNERSKIHFSWYFGRFPETILIIKNLYALFTMLGLKNGFNVKIKTLKHCENLLKVSNEIKQYVKNTIVRSH